MSLRRWFPSRLAAFVVVLASCESTPPTAPSSTFAIEEPASSTALSCPANIRLFVNHDRPVPIMFAEPTLPALGSIEKSSCTPASGSAFPIGPTLVTCSATEAAFAQSCSFSVSVLSRTLRRMSFLAFGDSITTGVFSRVPSLAPQSGVSTSYPAQMEAMLRDRYPDQPLRIINAGEPGERAPEGRARVSRVLDQYRPEVMLLLEGINQLVHLTPSRIADDLDAIVRSAQRRDTSVLIATLTPIGPVKERRRPGTERAVDALNRRIRSIARTRNLGPVVDLFAAMAGKHHLLGDDGLHPTTEGYRVIAEEFFGAITSRYEQVRGDEAP